MPKTICVTVRVNPTTKSRLEALAHATRRSKSYVIEEALEQYLQMNEWQINGIVQALAEADGSGSVFVDQQEVFAEWEAKVAR